MDETAAELRRRVWHTELRGDIRTWVSPLQTDYYCADGETHLEHNRRALAKARQLDGDA
mgnify:CR=1 FL=1